MTIELSREVETQLKDAAQAEGVTVGQFVEKLVAETSLRRRQISEFRSIISGRMASLDVEGGIDAEQVMAGLIADLPSR